MYSKHQLHVGVVKLQLGEITKQLKFHPAPLSIIFWSRMSRTCRCVATLLSRGQLRLFSSYRSARIISLPRNPPFSKLEAVTMSGSASSGESGDDSNPSASQQARAGMKANQTGTGWVPSALRRFFSQPAEGRPKRSTCLNEK